MLQAPSDDRCWFIVEQTGRVRAFENIPDPAETFTFIDISTRVDDGPNEAGLLGMAFHPNFAGNGQVFLSYTGPIGVLTSYVSRFTSLDGGVTLDPDSEEVLLSITQTRPNHNGGQITFGPDGYLYIGMGDGGGSNDTDQNAQNTMNLKGAMLRIDVDGATPYAIPADNPFADNALDGAGLCDSGFGAADCPELYAWGLRNPWRWSFDKLTGELWAGDVGQRALEEIDIIDLGGNYGWPFLEGTRCNTDVPVENCDFAGLPPITEYPRTTGRSVTGGYVYRGTAIPDLVGIYVYGDFATGLVMQYFDAGDDNTIEAQFDTDFGISSFGEANNGELYLLDLYAGGIHQIVAD
jgi:glucose/arabinose dehydrogenase